MKRTNRLNVKPLLAGLALLVLAMLACSVDLGFKSKPDETEIAKNVEASLAAVIATEDFNRTETALTLPTDTPTPLPTFTSASPPTETPLPTDTLKPTPAGVFISEIKFASKVDEKSTPLDPSDRFKKGINVLYATFEYSGMRDGMKVTVRWENNAKEFVSANRTWSWGESGRFAWSTSYSGGGGLPAGTWRFYFFVENKLVQSGTCVIYQ